MPTNHYREIGRRIQELRIRQGLTQTQLCQDICTPSMISQVESGKTTLSHEKMVAIAERLGVGYLDLVKGTEYLIETRVQLEILGNYVQQGMYDEALELSARLMIEFADSFQHEQYVELIFNRADALMRTDRQQEALELLMDLESDLRLNNRRRDLAKVHNKLGNAYFFAGDLLKAFASYGQANQIAESMDLKDYLYGQIVYNMGNVLYWLNRPEEAMVYFQKAQEHYGAIARHGQLADTLYMMGLIHNNAHDLESAEEFLRQARSLYEAQNMLQMSQFAREDYAFLVLSKQDLEKAKSELMSCIFDYQHMKDGNSRVAFTYSRLASLALQAGNLDEAERFLSLSDSMGFGQGVMTDSRAGYAYRVKAEFQLAKENYEQCVRQAKNSFKIFDKIGYVREGAKSLKLAAKAHELLGNIEEALRISNQVIDMLQTETVREGVRA